LTAKLLNETGSHSAPTSARNAATVLKYAHTTCWSSQEKKYPSRVIVYSVTSVLNRVQRTLFQWS